VENSYLIPTSVGTRGFFCSSKGCKQLVTLLAIAVGTIMALGGIFFLLASFQLLPHSVNIISQWGIVGKIAGGLIIGAGLLIDTGSGVILAYPHAKVTSPKLVQNAQKPHAVLPRTGLEITEAHFKNFKSYHCKKSIACEHAKGVRFFYYHCDEVDDTRWGCAWRAMMTCASSLGLYPSFMDLYNKYSGQDISAEGWAEPGNGKSYFDDEGFTESEIRLYKSEGTAKTPKELCKNAIPITSFISLREEILAHFMHYDTPIMADDVSYTFNIIGIRLIENSETILFIADPHKTDPGSGLYCVRLDKEGHQITTNGVDDGDNGLRSVQEVHFFDKGWMFLFPRPTVDTCFNF